VFVLNVIGQVLFLYEIVIFAAVVLSWVNPDPWNPIVRTIRAITDPVLDLFRRFIPMVGPLDLSPWVVVLLIQFVRSVVLPHLARSATGL
jgi:YggT family protein